MENSKHFYVTLFSNGSKKVYPSNKPTDFTIQLARPIDLGSKDDWEVGLCEFSCPPPATGRLKPTILVGDINALVYCSVIAQQFVGDDYVRCLRTFIHPSEHCDHSFKNVYYVPVEKRVFKDISILVTDLRGKDIGYKIADVPVKVVLHFRRV
jgi:hypothetical protein